MLKVFLIQFLKRESPSLPENFRMKFSDENFKNLSISKCIEHIDNIVSSKNHEVIESDEQNSTVDPMQLNFFRASSRFVTETEKTINATLSVQSLLETDFNVILMFL